MSLGGILASALLASTITVAPPPDRPATSTTTGAATGAVTLITGDRVVVTGGNVQVEPGPGRQTGFARQVIEGHLHVIPFDARPLLAQGVLDRRLFDVTQLLQWRYGDADRPDIPMITQSVDVPGTRRLAGLGMSTLRVSKKNAAQTWKDLTGGGARALAAGKAKLWLDGLRPWTLDKSVKQIGATEAWKQGMTGKGVTVAVLDSGYDPDHPDLKGVVAHERNFSDEPDIRDNLGHGTHVASIVAGAGEQYRGVAPGAQLAIGKIGGRAGASDSAILAGMEWAATEIKAKVVNLSLGGPDTPELDPIEQAVNTLSERTGTLFVIAAGNSGGQFPVSSPASADAALSVGAVGDDDQIAGFSSKGPREGDHAIKPDLTAPGVAIMAAQAGGTHVEYSGTSMAAPHVAGAAAIMAQRHPGWTGRQLKAALMGSATPTPGARPYEQGTGRVDLVRALAQQVVAEPANVWAAFPWDGQGERVSTKTITYTNSGDASVTLDLSTQGGEVLKLSAQRLEVPAGGTASVTLTIDATGKAPGDYPGVVTATSGQGEIRTLAGAYVEPESYDLTISAVGREDDVPFVFAQLYDPETGAVRTPVFQGGTARIRLPEGRWNLYADIAESGSLTITHATVRIDDGDQQITLDARQGRPASFTVDDPAATPRKVVDLAMRFGKWSIAWRAFDLDPTREVYAVPTREAGLSYQLRSVWDSTSGSLYDLVDHRTGGLPADMGQRARRAELAEVEATFLASGVAAQGRPYFTPRLDDELGGGLYATLQRDVTLPGTATYYRTPGLTWDSAWVTSTSRVWDAGKVIKRGRTKEVWNAAVTGPSFAQPNGTRTGDELSFDAGRLFADGVEGRTGADDAATGTATLTRDGRTIAETAPAGCRSKPCLLTAALPSEQGRYTLTTSMRRQVPDTALSSTVESAWTFTSANTPEARPLPLFAVRYAPSGLDSFNRARPGTVTRVPVRVERNPGAPQAKVKSLRLEMSSDDGASWLPLPSIPTGSGWTASVPNPRTAGFVSLRVTATDTSGTTVKQTVIRAYSVS
ncbi:S8 family peptidase [Nonomuraea jabiensis]|uniref:Subtilisin family serine protease n=1 Tax=Nonomuraea jabiensis TaxID=882448 RepID=A0A7W9GIA4_9ACTN|nr:S8 family serine peptidase [Nonomuraea jabiensis]MBB5784370.1 subtilisin family serine protease [Nonomuraea jabiensis]